MASIPEAKARLTICQNRRKAVPFVALSWHAVLYNREETTRKAEPKMKKTTLALVLSLALGAASCGFALQVGAAPTYEVKKSVFHYAPIAPERVDSFYGDVYFSQGYFEHPSTEYDSHLATASLAMVIASSTDFGPFDEAWYQSQPKFIEEYFSAIGFEGFTVNEDYRKQAAFDTIGLAAAKKEMGGYTIVAVTPRSGGYYREWGQQHAFRRRQQVRHDARRLV